MYIFNDLLKIEERGGERRVSAIWLSMFIHFYHSTFSFLLAHNNEGEGREKRKMNERASYHPIVREVYLYLERMQIFTRETDIIPTRTTHSLSLAERCISLSRLLRTYTHTHTHPYMHMLCCFSLLYLDGESNELFYLVIQTHTRTCLIVCLFSPAYVQFIMMITQFSISVYLSVQWAEKN